MPDSVREAAWLDWAAVAMGAVAVLATALSRVRARAWWVRVWDFPRLQVAALAAAALGALALAHPLPGGAPAHALTGLVLLALAYQAALIRRYTRLARPEVARGPAPDAARDAARTLALVEANVLQTNRDAARLVAVTRAAAADVLLFVETDAWWRDRLDAAFRPTHPHAVQCALPNTYGMLLYSRLPLERARVDFLVQDDVPSIQADVRLPGGRRVWLNAVHPRPPAPGESADSLPRDAELLVVAARVRERRAAAPDTPVVVFGDLNDVAWSHTTRLFQKTSGLLDPRRGRGLFSTFHARWPGLRWPLDHVFFSPHFRLVAMRRLGYTGSDHFPVHLVVCLDPDAPAEQAAPAAEGADLAEARDTVREAARGPAPDA